MKILVTGATGFIGSRLRAALLARGHAVIGVSRRPPAHAADALWIALDFAAANEAQWQACLTDVDVVVNAVGIFRETAVQRFAALHVRGAHTLFRACAQAGVGRVVQLSALGADADANTAYHRSKYSADEFLLAQGIDSVIVQPSLVFGIGGASTQVFLGWASLPMLPLPAGGHQRVQPIHVDDAVQALVALVEGHPFSGQRVPLVGPEALTLHAYLQALRQAMGLSRAIGLSIPCAVMSVVARAGDRLSTSLFDTASWRMLQRGNTAASDHAAQLLGRRPREVSQFIDPPLRQAVRHDACLRWLLPVFRVSIALVWIVTGIVSFGMYPIAQSRQLLARAGVPGESQPLMLFGAATLDLVLGAATLLLRRRRRLLWAAQATLILFYTAVITLRLPEFWLHPYGPVLKNLPMLAVLWALATLEPRDPPS